MDNCKRCDTPMRKGTAIRHVSGGRGHCVIPCSATARLVTVNKCPTCGYSLHSMKEPK